MFRYWRPDWRRAAWRIGLLAGLFWLAGCAQEARLPGGADNGDILFADAFTPGQTGQWHTEADASGSTAIEEERLVVAIYAPNIVQYAGLREPLFDDFVLEVDATLLEGPPDSSYGILFRLQEDGGFYRFNVTGEGFYIVDRLNPDGTWTWLTPNGWMESAAIKQGVNAANRLKVIVGGPNMIVFVNGEPLGQFTDTMGYMQGQVALNAGAFNQPGVRVAFDNLMVRQP
ncbi:MAG: hypothetical protein Fur0021_13130 [Candidatus Promineifilaceae bacterium]